jgi:hypothetical protein
MDFEYGVKRLAIDPYKNDSVPYPPAGPGEKYRYADVRNIRSDDHIASASYEVIPHGLLVLAVNPPPPAARVNTRATAPRLPGPPTDNTTPTDWNHYWSHD